MENKLERKRENGIYYTPAELAEYLVKPLITTSSLTILDPAYGEGALLLAAERIHQRHLIDAPHLNLFGCDTKPVNGLLKHLPKANLKNLDFFDYPANDLFDIVIMNPPYVRHHLQNLEIVNRYREAVPILYDLSYSSDLWSYFIVKAPFHLKRGGSIGAILPWSFLQADYARPLRLMLSEQFKSIKLLALNEKYFDEAEERIVLLWLRGYGEPCEDITVAAAKHLEEQIVYKQIQKTDWISDRVQYAGADDTGEILEIYRKQFGFSTLDNIADVKIGVVTGADKFFIRSYDDARRYGLSRKNLIPILTTAKDFPKLISTGTDDLKNLIIIKEKQAQKLNRFLSIGKKSKYHLTAHAKLRDPWYAVKVGEVPDAFFPYRISKHPALLLNDHRIQCTNSVHRVYFKGLSEDEKRWIAIALLSNIGQLSLEVNSKTYGRGMLKIEPKSLKKALVIHRNNSAANEIYNEVLLKLRDNNRQEAVLLATKFMNQSLNIPKSISDACTNALETLQNFRLA